MFSKQQIQVIYRIFLSIAIILFLYLLYMLYPFYQAVLIFIWQLFLPFLISIFIAYLLYPTIEKLQKQGVWRPLAILLIYFLFFGTLAYGGYKLYPAMVEQLREFNEQIPQLMDMYENIIMNIYESTSFLPEMIHGQMDRIILQLEKSVEDMIGNMLSHVTKVIDFIFFLAVIPVIVFYLLKDYPKLKNLLKQISPTQLAVEMHKLVSAIDQRLGQYIRGQLLVSLFIFIATLIVFRLLNIDYALLLATIMGFTNFIPYFGPIIGSIPVVAITITISFQKVIFALLAVLGIQILESNFLSPYIVGKSINMHPITIIFILLLGGKLFGIVGMILAVPVGTIIKEIVKYFISYKARH